MKNTFKRITFLVVISTGITLAATSHGSMIDNALLSSQVRVKQMPERTVSKLPIEIFQTAHAQAKPKNLKILPKDISHEELHKVMDNFKISLGVKCGFCHAKNAADSSHLDFASDAKPEKETARHMMRMTMKINKKYFRDLKAENGTAIQINCITCHHGQQHPEI